MGANLFPGTAGRRTTLPARFSGGRGHKSKRQQSQKDGHSPRNLGAGPAPVKDLKGQGSKGSGFGRPPLHEGDGDEEHLHRAAVVGQRHEEVLGGEELLALADVGGVAGERAAFKGSPAAVGPDAAGPLLVRNLAHPQARSEEHTSELQSLMRISYAVFCLKKKKKNRS